MSNVSTWSTTAGSNNSSPPDGWPEGMARSAVNDTAREMMAAIAKWYADARASLTTAGSSDAYTLTSNNTYASLASIPPLFFKANRANVSASVTMNVDGLGAKTWYRRPGKSTWQIGEILANSAYGVVYNSTLDAFETISVPQRAYTPAGHLFGLTLANNGSDATNDIDVATGVCTSSDNLDTLELNTAITKRLDSGWVVGTNQGGLDTGSIANTTYHVFAIKRPDTGVVDVLFSTSATSPTMPTNYTLKRRIGSIVRTGAAIKAFTQVGDEFLWLVQVRDVSDLDLSSTANTCTLTVPIGIKVRALVWTQSESETEGGSYVLVTSFDQTDTAVDSTQHNIHMSGGDSNTGPGIVRTNTSGQIRARGMSGEFYYFNVFTMGWIDDRGRVA